MYTYIYIILYNQLTKEKSLDAENTKNLRGKKKNNKQQSTVKTLFHPLVFTKIYDPPPLHFWN